MKKYLALLKYPDSFVENYLSNYFEDIEFMYIVSKEKYEELVNEKGKVKLKIADYELKPEEVIEKCLKEDRELILVGAESLKFLFRRSSGINKLSGNKITDTIKALDMDFECLCLNDPSVVQVHPSKEKQLLKDINKIKEGQEIQKVNIKVPDSLEESRKYLEELMNSEILAVDTETETLLPIGDDILGVCLAKTTDTGYYIPKKFVDWDLLKEVLITAKKIIMHNAKFDCNKLRLKIQDIDDIVLDKIEDTMLLEYCINENHSLGLKELALKYTYLGNYDDELDKAKKAYCKKYKIKLAEFTYDLLPQEILGEYGAKDAIATLQVYKYQTENLKNQINWGIYNKIKKISIYLGHIEQAGGIIDLEKYEQLKKEYEFKITELMFEMNEIAKQYGYIDVNFNSPKQLVDLLFDGMGLEPIKYTDSGQPSTDAETLEKLLNKYPDNKFLKYLLDYRKLNKLYSTYIKPIPERMYNGKIHPSFNITGTTSGRLSSNNPNFQNLPKKMRSLYIGNDEYPVILQADLKNAELHIGGFLAKESAFLEAFRKGEDLHGKMAVLLFNLDCKPNEVKEKYPEERQLAKTINFGILYGMTARRLAGELGITEKEANKYLKLFFDTAPNIRTWIEENKQFLLENGYLISYFGRIRHLPEVFSNNKGVKLHAIRSGINFLIQSVAADIITFSIPNLINKLKGKAVMFATVHDSVVFRVKEKYIDEVCKIIKEEFQSVIPELEPKIGVDFEIGKNWYELKEYNYV